MEMLKEEARYVNSTSVFCVYVTNMFATLTPATVVAKT